MTRATVDLIVFGLLWVARLPYSPAWLFLAGTLLLWSRRESWRAFGLGFPSARLVWLGVSAGAAFQVFSLFVVEPALAGWFTGRPPDVSPFRRMVGHEHELARWLFLSWTMAAFGEELAYRGWLMTRTAQVLGQGRPAWMVALCISAVLFGLAHSYQGPAGMLSTGITGAALGTLYLACGRNLWPAIVAHGTIDTVAVVLIYLGLYPGL